MGTALALIGHDNERELEDTVQQLADAGYIVIGRAATQAELLALFGFDIVSEENVVAPFAEGMKGVDNILKWTGHKSDAQANIRLQGHIATALYMIGAELAKANSALPLADPSAELEP